MSNVYCVKRDVEEVKGNEAGALEPFSLLSRQAGSSHRIFLKQIEVNGKMKASNNSKTKTSTLFLSSPATSKFSSCCSTGTPANGNNQ